MSVYVCQRLCLCKCVSVSMRLCLCPSVCVCVCACVCVVRSLGRMDDQCGPKQLLFGELVKRRPF